MKSTVLMTLLLGNALISGCVTASGNYCDVARAIRPSVVDSLSVETKRQILAENEKLAKLCGVKPCRQNYGRNLSAGAAFSF
jgi:hypothetical protein